MPVMTVPVRDRRNPEYPHYSLRDDSLSHGIEDQLRYAVQVQLLQYMRAVGLDGRGADIEDGRRLFIGPPLRDELQDFAFPVRQQVVAVVQTALFELPHVVLL